MAVTRIKNNQITDLTVNAAAKLQDFSVTSAKIANNLTYDSNLTVVGNLTVQGNVTAIDTHDLVVEDPLILLAKDQTGSPTLDIGFIGKRGDADNIAFVWDESADQFVMVFTDSELTNTTININSYASLQVLDLTAANLDISGNIEFSGNIVGNLTVTGNVDAENINANTAVTAASGEFSGNVSAGNLNANTNVTGTTITATGNLEGNNAVITNDVSANTGTFTGNVSGDTFLGNIDGTTGVFTGNVSGDTFLGNIDGTTGVFTGNVSGDTFLGNVDGDTGTFTGNVSGDTFLGNIDGDTGTFTGNVSGDTFLGNIDGDTGTFTGNVSGDTFLGNIDGTTGTFTGNVSGDTFLGNIDGDTGTFTGNVSGDTFLGNIDGDTGVFTGNVSGDTFLGNIDGATGTFTGNVSGDTFLGNIDGTTGVFTGNVSGDTFLGNIDGATGTFTGNVSGDTFLGNIDGDTGTFTGNVSAGNISTTGILDVASISASGNISGNNLISNNDVTTATVTASGNIIAANVNANTSVTSITITATGNLEGNNAVITNDVSANTGTFTGNVIAANLNANTNVTGITITASGNLEGNNAVITNDVSANTGTFTGNVIAANLNANLNVTATDVSATGNVDAGTAVNANLISGTSVTIVSTGDLDLQPSGNIDVSGVVITNMGSPVQSFDAATKQYVDDAVSSGITIHEPVRLLACGICIGGTYVQGGNVFTVTDTVAGNTVVFSTAANLQVNDQLWFDNSFNGVVGNLAYFVVSTPNTSAAVLSTTYNGVPVSNITDGSSLTESVRVNSGQGATLTATANGALVVDSVTANVADRILLESQTAALQNGVYVVTDTGNVSAPWILTRSADMNTYIPDNVNGLDSGDYFYVQEGANNAGESHVMTAPVGPVIIGYDDLVFTLFSASQVYSANVNAGLVLIGTQFNAKVDNDTTAFDFGGNISIKAGANLVTPNIGNATGNSLTLSGNGLLSATTVEASGNVLAGNVNSNAAVTGITITASGNLEGNNAVITNDVSANTGTFTGNIIAANLNANTNVTGITITASGNIEGNNAVITNDVSANTGTFTGNVLAANLNANTNVTGITITASGNLEGNNAVITNDVAANTGTFTGNIVAANLNANTNVTGITITATGNLEGNNAVITNDVSANTGTFTGNVSGDTFLGNVEGDTGTFTGNVSGDTFLGNIDGTTGTFTGNVSGDTFLGNIDGTTGVFTGNVSGDTFLGNIDGTTGVFTGNVSGDTFLGNIDGATGVFTGNVSADTFLGNIEGDTGTFTGNVSGDTFLGNIDGTTGVFTGNVSGDTFLGNIDGDTGTFTGNVIAANLNANTNVTGITITASGNLEGNNAVITNDVSADTFSGNSISVTGNVLANNVNANTSISSITITATGNLEGNNAVITNDVSANTGTFTGNVSADTFIGNISGNIDAGGANTEIQFNDDDILNGDANFTFDKSSGQVTISGSLVVDNVVVDGDDITSLGSEITINSAGADVNFRVAGDSVANLFIVDAGSDTVLIGTDSPTTGAALKVGTTDSMLPPVGNLLQRPGTPVIGMFRFSTSEDALEVYTSEGWELVGVPAFTVIEADEFNGDGSTVQFTLSQDSTTASTIVSINGVVQLPTTAYSVTGNILTFTEAPEATDVIDARLLTTTTTVTAIRNSSGNAEITVSSTEDSVLITGNLLPSANATFNLGSDTARWQDIFLVGNSIVLGDVIIKNTTGNTIGFFGPDGTTPGVIDSTNIDATAIANGTANIRVLDSANILVSAGGNANVGTFTGNGLVVSGSIEATNGFIGLDATSIANGTANVRTFQDSNVTVSAAGTANVLIVTSTGANFAGTVNATGNITGGNLITTGNIEAGNLKVTGIEAVTTLNVSGDTLISGNLTVSGNTITANVSSIVITDPILGLGRGANGNALTSNDGLDRGTEMFYFTTAEQIAFMGFDNSEGKMLSAANVSIANNIVTVNSFGTTVVGTLEATVVSATGNVSGGNLTTAGLISATGNITGGNLITAGLVSLSSITKTGTNGVGNIGSSTSTFNTIFAKATSAQYADLAEVYAADADYAPGTVVTFGGVREVTVSTTINDPRIAGVVSTAPSYIMNSALESEHTATVALTGRVPTRVTGAVSKGDMMVSAGDGTARAESNPKIGTVIGKALEDFDGDLGVIEVVVGRM
jgi:hypothetical protein